MALEERLETSSSNRRLFTMSFQPVEKQSKVDLKSERSIIDLTKTIKQTDRELRLVVDATGLLHNENIFPEKISVH